jgi:NAD(P)-dependent dehydrogenase (short-subunit alcohol dehydrogenase family)
MATNLFDLSEEVAVVIGGTGVLGGSMALALATSGAKVVVAGRSAERGKARVAEGASVLILPGDLPLIPKKLAEEVIQALRPETALRLLTDTIMRTRAAP